MKKLVRHPTLKEFTPGRGYTRQDWDEVSDNPEWTAEDFAKAKPLAEVLPDLAAAIRRARGAQKAPTKVQVTLRLDPDVVAKFRAGGKGWQSRINDTLKKAMG